MGRAGQGRGSGWGHPSAQTSTGRAGKALGCGQSPELVSRCNFAVKLGKVFGVLCPLLPLCLTSPTKTQTDLGTSSQGKTLSVLCLASLGRQIPPSQAASKIPEFRSDSRCLSSNQHTLPPKCSLFQPEPG